MANGNFLKAGALAVLALATASSFASATNHHFQAQRDTLPAEKNVFDQGLRQLDKAIEKLDASVGDPRWQQDLSGKFQSAIDKLSNVKWEQELGRALDKVNLDKVQQQLQESLSRIDMDKVKRDLSKALDNIDKAKVRAEVDKAFDEVDWDKMKRDLKKQLNEINTDIDFDKLRKDVDKAGQDAKRELERARKDSKLELKIDMDRLKSDMKKQRIEFDGQRSRLKVDLNKAHAELEAAKEELANYKNLTIEMEKDGLIKQDGDYTIEFRDGKLSINGEKQRRRVNKKYAKFFRKNDVRIRKENNRLNID